MREQKNYTENIRLVYFPVAHWSPMNAQDLVKIHHGFAMSVIAPYFRSDGSASGWMMHNFHLDHRLSAEFSA